MPPLVWVQHTVHLGVPELPHVLRVGGRKVSPRQPGGRETEAIEVHPLTSTCSLVHLSSVTLLTFVTWLPILRCIDVHWTHRKTPWSHDAHRGLRALQSAHTSFPGSLRRRRSWRWYRSVAVFDIALFRHVAVSEGGEKGGVWAARAAAPYARTARRPVVTVLVL